jgi:hypothetical protein
MIRKYLTLRILVKPARRRLQILMIESEDSMETERPVPSTRSTSTMGPGGRAVASRRGGGTGRRRNRGGLMEDSPPLSPHTTAPSSLPVQTEFGLPNGGVHTILLIVDLAIILLVDCR